MLSASTWVEVGGLEKRKSWIVEDDMGENPPMRKHWNPGSIVPFRAPPGC